MLLDYETLRIIWWVLLGVLLIGFAIMDGFDLGVATLLPWVGRTDTERRILLNTVGPVWEGNQVWLVLGGGAIFAAWPPLYATAFSGFYVAMILVLVALILRPVGFTFRSKIENARWRSVWDWALFISGVVPTLIFGVAVGNVLRGVPFHFDGMLRITYEGGFFGLLNPFGLVAGLTSVAMLTMHGGTYLAIKTEGDIAERARRATQYAAFALAGLFFITSLWAGFGIDGYALAHAAAPDGPSNPLGKAVTVDAGIWWDNFSHRPLAIAAAALAQFAPLATVALVRIRYDGLAFITSSLAVFGVIAAAGLTMFPFIMPSSSDPGSSLTVWDASSSHLTLFIMLIATVIFMPLILAYTAWAFRILRGKVTAGDVESSGEAY